MSKAILSILLAGSICLLAPDADSQATYTVTRLDDDVSSGSLRWAINQANEATPGQFDFIEFADGLTGTIEPLSELPALTDPLGVYINGCTSGDGPRAITLDGNLLSGGMHGLTLDSDGNEICGLIIINFPGSGINIQGSFNDINDNYIGLESDGTTAAGNYDGITFNNIITQDNQIGLSGGNVISGNSFTGITTYFDLESLEITGNFIGTTADGTAALPNTHGILIGDAFLSIGSAIISNNLISGNTAYGVRIFSVGDPGIFQITGNKIGTNITGTAAIPNDLGILLVRANNITIGGNLPTDRNIISGNIGVGIDLSLPDSDNNNIIGNYIGVGSDGSTPIPNQIGINLSNFGDLDIGGLNAGEGNIISSNSEYGIRVSNNDPWSVNVLGNTFENNGIAGSEPGAGAILVSTDCHIEENQITNNYRGIVVTQGNTKCSIRRNTIYGNTQLGIDLGNDGVTLNDPGDGDTGPNNLLNYPEFYYSRGNTNRSDIIALEGTACADCWIDLFKVEGSGVGADPSGYGEAFEYVGSAQADGTGSFRFENLINNQFYTATATDEIYHCTSEFSANILTQCISSEGGACEWICGDADGSLVIDILDVVYIINFKYKQGPAPIPEESADVDGTLGVTILDVVYIINFKYKDGPAPVCP